MPPSPTLTIILKSMMLRKWCNPLPHSSKENPIWNRSWEWKRHGVFEGQGLEGRAREEGANGDVASTVSLRRQCPSSSLASSKLSEPRSPPPPPQPNAPSTIEPSLIDEVSEVRAPFPHGSFRALQEYSLCQPSCRWEGDIHHHFRRHQSRRHQPIPRWCRQPP